MIDPGNGHIVAQYAVGHAPDALAAGGGSVWSANGRDGTVSRIDRGRGQVTTIDVGGEPTAVAFGGGSLWVADGENRRVDQVDSAHEPRRRAVCPRATRRAAWRSPAAPSGSPRRSTAQVERLDLAQGGRVRRIDVPGGPAAIAAGGGAVWVAGEEDGVVTKLDPRSGAALQGDRGRQRAGRDRGRLRRRLGRQPRRRDGDADRRGDGCRSARRCRVGGSPVAVAAGARRDLGGRRRHGRRDPHRPADAQGDAGASRVGSAPSALAVAGGSVWAAATASRASHRGGTLRFESAPFDAATASTRRATTGRTGRCCRSPTTASSPTVASRAPAAARSSPTSPRASRSRATAGAPTRSSCAPACGSPTARRCGPRTSARRSSASCGSRRAGRGVLRRHRRRRRVQPARGATSRRASRPTPRRGRSRSTCGGPIPSSCTSSRSRSAYVLPARAPATLIRGASAAGNRPVQDRRVRAAGAACGSCATRSFRSWSAEARPDGFPDAITVTISGDAAAQVAAVQHGRADAVVAAGAVRPSSCRSSRPRARPHRRQPRAHGAEPTTNWLFLNVREPPFDDPRVRRALNYAIDRRRVVELAGGSGLGGPVLPGDPARAARLRADVSRTRATRRPRGGWSAPDLARARRLVAASGTRGARVRVWGLAEVRGRHPLRRRGPAHAWATASGSGCCPTRGLLRLRQRLAPPRPGRGSPAGSPTS